MIYHETLGDRIVDPAPPTIPAQVWTLLFMERDTVVHELGHAVARSEEEPVTRIHEAIVGRYTEEYLDLIRSTLKPAGP